MAKLMLVEDDNNLREIYQARLQAEGFDIVTAKDGEEALTIAKAEKPDLVISDVMMPKISGFEMLDILRNTDGLQHIKVIMLTALGQSDDQSRADKLGADRYLVKSQVTLEDIVKAAHDLLQDAGAEEAPAAQPEPAPAAAVAAAPAAPPADNTAAQSTAQEAASVQANVESFVAGAEPSAAATPAPPAPTPPPSNNDQLMADAAASLAANSDPAPAPPPAGPAQPATTDAAAPTASQATENVSIAHKKVIAPLDSEPKKDINELAALEEAKVAANQPPPPPTAVIATNEKGAETKPLITPAQSGTPPVTKDDDESGDPNNIAL
jgi:DNA-binding response OmpR family regulator